MDAQRWNRGLDLRLAETGVVDEQTFQAFADAWVYDAATTTQWLQRKLKILMDRAQSGQRLQLFTPNGEATLSVTSADEVQSWIGRYFPSVM